MTETTDVQSVTTPWLSGVNTIDPNRTMIMTKAKARWIASILHNGEFSPSEQERHSRMFAATPLLLHIAELLSQTDGELRELAMKAIELVEKGETDGLEDLDVRYPFMTFLTRD